MGKGQASQPFTKSLNKDEQEVVSGKQNVKAACPKDKLEYKLFSSPGEDGKGRGIGEVILFLLFSPPPIPFLRLPRWLTEHNNIMFSGRTKYTYIHQSLVHGFNRYNVIWGHL